MYEQCVWMKLMWYVRWNLCARYVLDMCSIWNLYMWYVLQIVGFNKKQKKQTICRLFAVCHRRQRALCRLPRTAKKPRGSQLCFLGADPFGQFAYSGRRQRLCRQWQTAKNLHFAISGRRQRTWHLVTCRWHHKADGKDQRLFAVCGGRQRFAVSHLTDWQRKYCRPPSLPSAADGKEPLPSAARKQTAKKLFTVAFFAGAFCRPRLTAKVFAVRLSSLCRPPWQTAK